MERFNPGQYRSNLSQELREKRSESDEGRLNAIDTLNKEKTTEEYRNAEEKYRRLSEWDETAEQMYEKERPIIEEILAETRDLEDSRNLTTHKLSLYSAKREKWQKNRPRPHGTISEYEIFRGEFDGRDYGLTYGSDYPGEISPFQQYLNEEKFVFEKLGVFSEDETSKFIERFKNVIDRDDKIPHESFRILETLAVSGITGASLAELKSHILRSGNFNILRKFSEEFPYKFSAEEMKSALAEAVAKRSLFDIVKLTEELGEDHVELEVLEIRNELFREAQEKFTENREKIKEGVQNRDFLTHFTPVPFLDSVLREGVLSNLDQTKLFGTSNSSEGNDLQRLTGRFDSVSVIDVFKGANEGNRDSKIFEEMQNKISRLVHIFIREKYPFNPARIFRGLGQTLRSPSDRNEGTLYEEKDFTEEVTKYREKYTEIICSYQGYEERIDPNEKSEDSRFFKYCAIDHRKKRIRLSQYFISEEFHTDFFNEWSNDKEELMNSIKQIMREAYIESNSDISNKQDNLANFESFLMRSKSPFNRTVLVLDPSLERTFVQSLYDGESLVEGSIPPDKILGSLGSNAHFERVCYNEGKVSLEFLSTEADYQEEDVLFETPNGVVLVKNPYN